MRVSTDEQAVRGLSLPAQMARIHERAALDDTVVGETIVDDGESAKSLKRPGLSRLLALDDAGLVDTVIIARRAIFLGEDLYVTILSHGAINPLFCTVGPVDGAIDMYGLGLVPVSPDGEVDAARGDGAAAANLAVAALAKQTTDLATTLQSPEPGREVTPRPRQFEDADEGARDGATTIAELVSQSREIRIDELLGLGEWIEQNFTPPRDHEADPARIAAYKVYDRIAARIAALKAGERR